MKTKLILLILISFITNSFNYAQVWTPVGLGTNNTVWCMKNDTVNNLLYVGGEFSLAGGISVNNIAKWNGSNWDSLSSGINGYVFAMCIYNGELYVGGSFSIAGGLSANNIAKWNGLNWSSLGSGTNGMIKSLTVYNGELYVGGYNTTIAGGINVNNIAKWNGSIWTSVGTGIEPSPAIVNAQIVFNNELYVGGEFPTAGGISVNNIAKWNGTNWSNVGQGIEQRIFSFSIYNDELYVGGNIIQAGSNPIYGIAKWNGVAWDSVDSGIDYEVAALTVYDSNLYAGGLFWTASGVSVDNIARWNGTNWSTVGNGIPNTNGLTIPIIWSLEVYNNELYAGGNFNTTNGGVAEYIAKWRPTPLNINDKILTSALIIYPNPNNGNFKIIVQSKNNDNLQLKIYNILGCNIYESPIDNSCSIDLPKHEKGIYLICVMKGNELLFKKKIFICD